MYFRPGGRDDRERYQYSYPTVLKYLKIKCRGKEVGTFFKEFKLEHIVICGFTELAICFLEDLKKSKIAVDYIVDTNMATVVKEYQGIEIVGMEAVKDWQETGIVIITDLYAVNRIVSELLNQGIPLEKIINLNDVLYSL